jgi:hypothetical protein
MKDIVTEAMRKAEQMIVIVFIVRKNGGGE